ncbi:MAG: acetyltransferase [Winogradskyella sp.]|uniref:acetyltransferase n=1 Tax=Winogradskyella sp. TaxID=1883156 RepID=UPI0018365032|nr:acetyltransferase [Winogradskyella sp.]
MNQLKDSKTLNILGCVPFLLNILFELAQESNGIESYRILKNTAVDDLTFFNSSKEWNVDIIEPNSVLKPHISQEQFAFSVVGVQSKELVYDYFKERLKYHNHQFINLVHPTSYISRSVKLNYGLQLEPLSTLAACSTLGFGVNIKRNTSIGHHCIIEDFATINPGVTLSSFVKIGRNTMIGSGTTVKNGITIGKNSIIGIGSAVVKDIPDNSIAYGNPCVVHRQNSKTDNIKCN